MMKRKMMIIKKKFIVQKCVNQPQKVEILKDYNQSEIMRNHIQNLKKDKKITFEDDMSDMKTKMNQFLDKNDDKIEHH